MNRCHSLIIYMFSRIIHFVPFFPFFYIVSVESLKSSSNSFSSSHTDSACFFSHSHRNSGIADSGWLELHHQWESKSLLTVTSCKAKNRMGSTLPKSRSQWYAIILTILSQLYFYNRFARLTLRSCIWCSVLYAGFHRKLHVLVVI